MNPMEEEITGLTRQRISEALFLIGFGISWAINWIWPGIVVAFGITWTASLAIRRKYWAATVIATLLCVVPAVYTVAETWEATLPLLVVGIGIAGMIRALYLSK